MKRKSRYDVLRTVENRLCAEVARETPDTKDRVLAAVRTHEERPAPASRRRPVMKYAVSFVLVAAVFCGALTLPKSLAGFGKKAAQAGFTVYVNAEENGASSMPGSTAVLSTTAGSYVGAGENSASSETAMTPNRSFTIRNDTPGDTRVGGAGLKAKRADGRYDVSLLYVMQFKCSAEGLTKVTYSTNFGSLDRAIHITNEQFESSEFREKMGLENIMIGDSRVSYGYAPCGNELTLNCGKDYDGIFGLKYTKTGDGHSSDWERNMIRTQGVAEFLKVTRSPYVDDICGTKLKITAAFSDGSTCEKTVALSTKDGVFLTATLLN